MLTLYIKLMLLIFLCPVVHDAIHLDYSDLEALDLACPERDQCSKYKNDRHYMDRSCECDSACTRYNDCCIDAPERSSGQGGLASNMTCLQYGQNRHSGVYVISKCSSNWDGPQQVREKCEGLPDFSDPVWTAPVTSISREITYKNLYCAECNRARMESLKIFEFKLACEDLDDLSDEEIKDQLTYNQERNKWGVNRLDTQGNSGFTACEVIFSVPNHLTRRVRFCRANIISTCAADWTREYVERACEEYMTIVFDQNNAYRNPHCAICNHKTVSEISCTTDLFVRRPFSLIKVIDFSPRVKDTSSCPTNEIYDPFTKRCRQKVCAFKGYTIVNGKCVFGG